MGYDDGYDADFATYTEKYVELTEPAEKLFFRMVEVIERPKAVGALREKLDKIENLMQKWETTHPQVTDEERADVLSKVEDVKNTLLEKEEAQAAADPSEDPVFTSAEVPLLTKEIQALLSKLSKRPKPKVEKKNETDSDAKANSTESTEKEGEEKSTEEGEEKSTEEGEEKSTEDMKEEDNKDDAVDESKAEDNVDGDAQNDEVISEEEQKAEDEL